MKVFESFDVYLDDPKDLNEVCKILEDMGYFHSKWIGIAGSDPIILVSARSSGTYEYYNNAFGVTKMPLTVKQLREKYKGH